MHQITFGTGGWRDLIGRGFIYDNITAVAQALTQMILADHK